MLVVEGAPSVAFSDNVARIIVGFFDENGVRIPQLFICLGRTGAAIVDDHVGERRHCQ